MLVDRKVYNIKISKVMKKLFLSIILLVVVIAGAITASITLTAAIPNLAYTTYASRLFSYLYVQ